MMKHLLLITLCAITLSHAADESIKALMVAPETSLAGSNDAPNPLLTINKITKTLSDHIVESSFPTGIALVYDSGTLTGATAAYKRVKKSAWSKLSSSQQDHLTNCLSTGRWALLPLQDFSTQFSHCLYLGSNDTFDARSKICELSWS